jgi:hypothetical protein
VYSSGHAPHRAARGAAPHLVTALATIDPDSARNLAEFTEAGLGDTAGRQIWRTLMATRTFPFVSEMRQQGRVEALAEAILAVFSQRGIEVDEATRARIESCDDAEVLKQWLLRSVVVASASELFD